MGQVTADNEGIGAAGFRTKDKMHQDQGGVEKGACSGAQGQPVTQAAAEAGQPQSPQQPGPVC